MNKIIKKKDILILVALKKELPKNYLNDFNVVYTGVGKVNASFAIYDSYLKFKPLFIINYGSAGALNKELTGLTKVTSFFDRDFYYSSGIFLTLITPNTKNDKSSLNKLKIGQLIYTPSMRYESDPNKYDYPYSGYLYLEYQKQKKLHPIQQVKHIKTLRERLIQVIMQVELQGKEKLHI